MIKFLLKNLTVSLVIFFSTFRVKELVVSGTNPVKIFMQLAWNMA
jgi:hypothetical protein